MKKPWSSVEPSYWDHAFFTSSKSAHKPSQEPQTATINVAIVGGGLLGCCLAHELNDRAPQLNVVVFDRCERPVGASTRNAGFSCFGSVGEIAADVDRLGPDAARALVEQRVRGLGLLLAKVDPLAIDFRADGGSEVFLEDHPAISRIEEINNLLAPLFTSMPFTMRDDLIPSYGLSPTVKHLVHTPFEGELHSGKLLKALWPKNRITERVVGVSGTSPVTLHMERGTVKAERVVLCTNAWLSELHAGLTVTPARGQILVTEPLPNLSMRGTFHMDQGFVYFRTVGNRVLLGGARNRAFQEETTTQMETTTTIQDYLEHVLHTVILPGKRVSIDHRWAGVMAFAPDHKPFIQKLDEALWAAMTCNGMGVALAASVAQQTATLVLQDAGIT